MALITLAEYKAYANISTTAYDTQLGALLSLAQEQVRTICGRNTTDGLESASRTEVLDGNNQNEIQLREWPVTSVTSVALIDDDGTSNTLTATADYVIQLNSGLLARSRYPVTGRFSGIYPNGWNGFGVMSRGYQPEQPGTFPCWPAGKANISVVYTGGYATIPYGIKLACYRAIDMMRADAGQGAYRSESVGGEYSYTRADPGDGLLTLHSILGPYMTGVA